MIEAPAGIEARGGDANNLRKGISTMSMPAIADITIGEDTRINREPDCGAITVAGEEFAYHVEWSRDYDGSIDWSYAMTVGVDLPLSGVTVDPDGPDGSWGVRIDVSTPLGALSAAEARRFALAALAACELADRLNEAA